MKISNLVSSVFFLSKSKTDKEVVKRIEKLLDLMKLLKEDEQLALARWTRTMFLKNNEVQEYLAVNYIEEEEDGMALEDLIPGAIQIWKQQARENGLAEGREEGRAEGRKEGKISTLMRVLTLKLGKNPSKTVVTKLKKLSLEELEEIESRVFEIESWDEI